ACLAADLLSRLGVLHDQEARWSRSLDRGAGTPDVRRFRLRGVSTGFAPADAREISSLGAALAETGTRQGRRSMTFAMEHFVTLFDSWFLPPGLALHSSLEQQAG